jgi:hypothetical protein
MSTKTMKQRIALVAVSALTAGVFSVVSAPVANAATGDLVIGANGAAATVAVGTCTSFGLISGNGAVTGTASSPTAGVMYDSGTIAVLVDDGAAAKEVVTVSGGTFTSFNTAGTAPVLTGLTTIGIDHADGNFCVLAKPNSGATSMVITSYTAPTAKTSIVGGTSVDRIAFTVTTTANAGSFSASGSRAKLETTAAAAAGDVADNADGATATYVANGGTGFVRFLLNDVNGLPMASSTIVSASATGGAVVSFDNATFAANVQSTYGAAGFGNIYVKQGTSNTPVSQTLVSLTVGASATPFVTKGLRIVGDVDKIELSTPLRGKNGAANAAGFQLAVKDSAGNLIAGITPSATGSSINASVNAITPAVSISTDVKAQAFTCSAVRGTSTITYTHTNARTQTITSNALPVVCAGDPYKYTASLDKASYTQGSIATLTISATDLDGKPVSDYSVLGTGGAGAISITCGTNMTVVTAPADANTFSAGIKTIKYAVGSTAGSYNCVVDLPAWNSTSTPQAAITVPYTISGDGSVSNADVLKSIVALIASINKQISALQKLILKR